MSDGGGEMDHPLNLIRHLPSALRRPFVCETGYDQGGVSKHLGSWSRGSRPSHGPFRPSVGPFCGLIMSPSVVPHYA